MKTSKFERKGSRKALLIGLPLKLAFCFLLVYFSGEPYYLLNSVIRSIGLLHPFIWIGPIMLILIVLFWIQGKKITKNLK